MCAAFAFLLATIAGDRGYTDELGDLATIERFKLSTPGLQAAYRQIKRAEFDVVLSRAAQPSWADNAGIVLKGFSDPGTRTVTIYLRNLKNADEVAGVLAHESHHAMSYARFGTMTPRGTRAAEIAADLRKWMLENGRRPTASEREASMIETIIRMQGGGY